MSPFPRPGYDRLTLYDPQRAPVDLDLSDNTNLWGTHPAALARIRGAGTDDLARYPELYADTLRRAVADRFDVATECVTTGAGSDDVLDSAFRAVYAAGAVARYAAPTFSMIEPFASMNGMDAQAVPWPEALAEPGLLLEGGPDLVYLCRPNNPTGESAPLEWIERLVEMNEAGGALLVIDEAYADFSGETLVGLAARTPRLLVARTASKAYGLAGLRCGFAVGTPETVVEIEKSRGPCKVGRLTIEAAAAAVRDEEGWMASVVAECVANRERLAGELESRGLSPLPSTANFLLVPAPSGSAQADMLAFRARGVQVRPFTGIPGMGEGLRVTVGPWDTAARFLSALDEMLEGGTGGGGGPTSTENPS